MRKTLQVRIHEEARCPSSYLCRARIRRGAAGGRRRTGSFPEKEHPFPAADPPLLGVELRHPRGEQGEKQCRVQELLCASETEASSLQFAGARVRSGRGARAEFIQPPDQSQSRREEGRSKNPNTHLL
ncbi:hypothetical protein CgunFtcFv8_004788 [Champsocephalus gunnari]|uniref:Uncharacterized protein n=1 Tax=Champsocephalus gunnari TaxID=52237 RepID=A0AAN8E4V9_CHAGU|nr:hypothetical protein CgunFtcFv8_004788 [Champsocephalus gunnari]